MSSSGLKWVLSALCIGGAAISFADGPQGRPQLEFVRQGEVIELSAETVAHTSELLQALSDGTCAGTLLTRHGAEVVAYAKCDGLETLVLMCLQGLSQHLPSGYANNCAIVEKAIRDGQLTRRSN